MSYRRYRKPRYWSRPYYNRRPYDASRSRYHYVFGFNTGEAATIVRETFFSLSGDTLDFVLDEYGTKYGKGAKAYAKSTIYKWKTGNVNMSDALVGRLLDFLPPLMTPEQKNRVVEAIWKAHARRSMRYAYIGPDTDVEAFCEALGSYLNGLNVTHAIPGDIERAFSWLSDDDAIAKQELLNHFMEKQLDAAFAAGRYYANLIVERIKTDTDDQISKFEHTIIVGDHQVVIKADKRRSGFIFSNSSNDFYKLPFKLGPAWWLAGAAVVAGFIMLSNYDGNTSQGSGATQLQSASRSEAHGQGYNQPGQYAAAPQPDYQSQQYAAAPGAEAKTPVTTAPTPVRRPTTSAPSRDAAIPAAAPRQHVVASAATAQHEAPALANGCATYAIASVNGAGSNLVLSTGAQFAISESLMRIEAAAWSTGDQIVACVSGNHASLKRDFQSVQAEYVGQATVRMYGCRTLYIGYTVDGGAKVETTDGSVMNLVDNSLSRIEATHWTTGETVAVCTAQQGAVAYAGLKHDLQEVEAVMDRVGSGRAIPTTCSQSSVADAVNNYGVIRVGGARYRIDDSLMKIEANQMGIGDPVVLCTYSTDGSTYASIAKSDFERVQAYRVP